MLCMLDFLNWGYFVVSGVIVCKDGSFLVGWSVMGVDFEGVELSVLEIISF